MSLSDIPSNAIIAEAAGIVSKVVYYSQETSSGALTHWMIRAGREERIANFRKRHGIADTVPEHLLILAITEDWDLS